MTHVPVVDILQGKHAVGSTLTVKGWIRTRRDSKAGISFLAIHDGSCFNPVQAVVPNSLSNYESEILRLTTSCSVAVTGVVKESQGAGQAFEIDATEVVVLGFVEIQIHTQWRQNVILLNICVNMRIYASEQT